MAKSVVVQQNGVSLVERMEAMRKESDNLYAKSLAQARAAVDGRIAELVQYRALSAVDAVLA